MMQTDVKAVSLAASGDISAYPTRVRGLVVEPGASAGSVVVKDGGSGGTTVFTINTIAGGETFIVISLPKVYAVLLARTQHCQMQK